MSMNSDIVKGVVGTSTNADGSSYKTFGDIKLYGGNVYKVANSTATSSSGDAAAVVGRFCHVGAQSGSLLATKPYYSTAATTSPVADGIAYLHCNGFVLSADSVTGELYVAMSGVISQTTKPLTGDTSSAVNEQEHYYLDYSDSPYSGGTVVLTDEEVVATFNDGSYSSNFPKFEASIRPVAYATSRGTIVLDFPPQDSSDARFMGDKVVLYDPLQGNNPGNHGFIDYINEHLRIKAEKDVKVYLDYNGTDGTTPHFFSVLSGDPSSEVFKVNGDGDVDITGYLLCRSYALVYGGATIVGGAAITGNLDVSGTIESNKIETSGTDPLVIDASSVIIENTKSDDTSSITLRDNASARTSISLIEGTGVFGDENNYGFRLEYDGVANNNHLALTSGYGTYTKDVFTVRRDNGANTPNTDIVFKGVVTCDPATSTEGGLRTNYLGGGDLGLNSIRLSTHSSDGHFTANASDTGTFTLYGPEGDGGKLQIAANSVQLTATTDLILVGAAEGDLNAGLGSGSTFLLAVDPSSGKVYRDTINTNTRSLFTGTHAYRSQEDLPIGSSVTLTGGSLALTTSTSQTNCVGIIQQGMQASEDTPIATSTGEVVTSGNVYYVAAVGDSIKGDLLGFKVCNEGGDISAGDLLVTSSTAGRLMKQADDIIRSSTVGKAMQDVAFNDSGEADDIYGFIYCG